METFVGFVIACVMILVVLGVVLRIIAACHRFLCLLRGEAAPDSVHVGESHSCHAGAISYRTRNGRSDYRFRIEHVGGDGYRVYILDQPGYGPRDKSAHATHRYSDSHGYYICWNHRLRTVGEARKVAALWADKTENYILYGTRF